jgi:hypothetical protein
MLRWRQLNPKIINGTTTLALRTLHQLNWKTKSGPLLYIEAWYLQRIFSIRTSLLMARRSVFLLHALCTADLIDQFTTNSGFVFEMSAHWISSYFLGDKFLRVPSSPEEAFMSTEREAAFLRKRHPDTTLWTNESYSGAIKFFK